MTIILCYIDLIFSHPYGDPLVAMFMYLSSNDKSFLIKTARQKADKSHKVHCH